LAPYTPKVIDKSADEQSALLAEQQLLSSESSLLSSLQGQSSYGNEVLLDGYESIISTELSKANQELEALNGQKQAYSSHISEVDSNIININTALSNLNSNLNSLTLLSSHAKILNLTERTSTNLTISAPGSSKIYNNPPVLVTSNGGAKQVPGRWSPAGLFSSSATFALDNQVFSLKYLQTGTCAIVTGTTTGPFDLSVSNTLLLAIDGGLEQTLTINAGDVININAVTVDEFVNVFNSVITGAKSSNSSNHIEIKTNSLNGSSSSVQFTGGTAIAIFGFGIGITTGSVVSSAQASLTNSAFTTTINGVQDLNIDVTTAPNNLIFGLINTINSNLNYSLSNSAYLISRIAQSYRISDGDTLIVSVNGGLPKTITFSAVPGQSTSGANAWTRIDGVAYNNITISLNGDTPIEISIGAQLTAKDIAASIQSQMRSVVASSSQLQAAYSQFICEFRSDNKYHLISGTGGTGSSVVVTNGTNDAAAVLKLGIANGGSEAVGSGDFANSSFATLDELNSVIVSSEFNCDLSSIDYLKIQSTILGLSSRIQIIGGTAKTKLGFDSNDDDYPYSDFVGVSTSALDLFNLVDITIPYSVTANSLINNVNVTYYTIDNSQIINRQSIITNRLTLYISTRLSQITARVSAIVAALTDALYAARRAAVQARLNKKTGSYVQVGNKTKHQASNQDVTSSNNDLISTINKLLP
jgi:hypothetical protein